MSEPRTAAGRLFVAYEDANDEGAGNSLGHLLGIRHWTIRDVVLAIEAEAASQPEPAVTEALRRLLDAAEAMLGVLVYEGGKRRSDDLFVPEREAINNARRALAAVPTPSPAPAAEPSSLPPDPADDPMLGDEGYPTEQELQRIQEWPMDDFRALMEYVRPRWEHYGSFDQHGDRFRLATGGWSGNESIIGALEHNQMFQTLCALSWHTGGLYFYDVQRWDDNPVPGKRLRVRDSATPMEDGWSVVSCDHDEARAASPSPAVAPPLDLPGHKCRKIAEANPCGTGRELWLGELLEPIPGYEHETHCLHVTTPMKSVVFGVYRGDFDLLSVFGYLVADRKPLTERWLGRMADAFVKRAAYAEGEPTE